MTLDCQFPDRFVWGAATSALQVEGATGEDGRGPSVWDVFCRMHPERIHEGATPEAGCDHYRRWQEDVRLMKEIGLTGYRLSIAWPRLFPSGRGALNRPGADFYHRLFDRLLQHGIEPNVTLYHWDLPQGLADVGGWENRDTIHRFVDYACECFSLYGDRVKLWSTINEPGWSTLNGWVTGLFPPCKQSLATAVTVATHLVLAHARTVPVCHETVPHGQIGLVLNLSPVRPASGSPTDEWAARIADGMLNRWFLEPAVLGRLPDDVLELYRERELMPRIDEDDLTVLRRSVVDYLGVNYYYPLHASADAPRTGFFINTSGRPREECRFSLAGLFRLVKNPRGRHTDWGWEIDPDGLRQVLTRVDSLKPGLPIYVTENGIGLADTLRDGTVDDQPRIDFVRDHLVAVHRAIAGGVNVRGYYVWSLMDNFSWLNGYRKRYGLVFVDRTTLGRHLKRSAHWYREVSGHNGF